METTVYAVGNQSTREVAGWLVGFPYCVSELRDTENQNELTGWPVQATLISELGIPVVKCRQGHPHAEGGGKTVGHLQRQLAFSIVFRKNERVTRQCYQLDPCGGWCHRTRSPSPSELGPTNGRDESIEEWSQSIDFLSSALLRLLPVAPCRSQWPSNPGISSSDPSFFLLLQTKSSICSPRLLIYPGSCFIRGQFPLNGPCKILFLLTLLAY